MQLEVGLSMLTGRALCRSLCSFMQVSAITAYPDHFLAPLEDGSLLDILEESEKASSMPVLRYGYAAQRIGDGPVERAPGDGKIQIRRPSSLLPAHTLQDNDIVMT